jgi:hypothetical protein
VRDHGQRARRSRWTSCPEGTAVDLPWSLAAGTGREEWARRANAGSPTQNGDSRPRAGSSRNPCCKEYGVTA